MPYQGADPSSGPAEISDSSRIYITTKLSLIYFKARLIRGSRFLNVCVTEVEALRCIIQD